MNNISHIKCIGLFLLSSICSLAYAGGYKIPETSLNSSALSSAYIASAHGADSSYYNPANMVFNDNIHQFEATFSYLQLSKVKYTSTIANILDANSNAEQFIIPNFHYSSKDLGNYRLGLSIVSPAGLSKSWDNLFARASTESFTLKTIEFNPTISYKLNNIFSLGAGVRFVYANGKVQSNSDELSIINPNVPSLARDMSGNELAYGYNLALAYKPNSKASFGVTYRSKIDLKLEGHAKLSASGIMFYNGNAYVNIPLPATLDLAFAYNFLHTSIQSTLLEFVFERNYWSSYKTLDFDYDIALPVFDSAIEKKWHDSNVIRLGLTHSYNRQIKLMLGYAIDKTPISSKSLGFDLPSADGQIFSTGFEYKLNKQRNYSA